ncbi:MAG: hypothetical protein IIB30_02255, partial [Chloroflexi bacterium]|nr:hypothetical protein [Chloroflexota bacterium]
MQGLFLAFLTILVLSCGGETASATAPSGPTAPTATVAAVTPTLPVYVIPVRTPIATAPEPTTEAELAGTPVSGATPEPAVTPEGTVTPDGTVTPIPMPTPTPDATLIPTATPARVPTATPPTPTPAPTATPIPASVFELVDQELASIQQIIPALFAVGDLTVVCTELNQLIEAITVPGVARTLDEYINDMAADYWVEGEQRYSVRLFQGLPPPGQIVGAALTPPCLSSAATPTPVPTATPFPPAPPA